MNEDQPQPRPVVNLNKIVDELEKPLARIPGLIQPKPMRGELRQYNALQGIAIACTKLTWKEAEKMGAAIQVKMKDGQISQLTAAIQSWAEEWEKFGDE